MKYLACIHNQKNLRHSNSAKFILKIRNKSETLLGSIAHLLYLEPACATGI